VYVVQLLSYYARAKGLSRFRLVDFCSVMPGFFVDLTGLRAWTKNTFWCILHYFASRLSLSTSYLRDVGRDPEELTFLFRSEKQNRETLAASTAKFIGQGENSYKGF
jgi:hypothetical protein